MLWVAMGSLSRQPVTDDRVCGNIRAGDWIHFAWYYLWILSVTVCGRTFQDQPDNLCKVLSTFKETDLKHKLEKCQLLQRKFGCVLHRDQIIICMLLYCKRTYKYLVSGLYPPSGILNIRKHDVSETGYVFFLRWGGQNTLLGLLERANLITVQKKSTSRKYRIATWQLTQCHSYSLLSI
jgi:hypothetical protein